MKCITTPKIKEKDICKAFYTQFKALQSYNQLPKEIVLFHIANERDTNPKYTILLKKKGGGFKKNGLSLVTASLKSMGMIGGVADYCVLLPQGKVAFIEFKRNAKCKLTTSQQEFKAQCETLSIPYNIAYSADNGVELLIALVKSKA